MGRRTTSSVRRLRHVVLPVTIAACLAATGCVTRVDDATSSTDVADVSTTADTVETGNDPTSDTGMSGDDDTSEGTPDDRGEPGAFPTTETVAPDPSGLPSLAERDPSTIVGVLDNGLTYYVRENDNPGQKVDMRLVVDAGSGVEDDDQVGGAHFLEHMLFNGTEKYPENELIDVLRSFGAGFGADVNAYTSYDETVYTLTVPTGDAEFVETGFDVLEQWLTSATITPDDVVAERGIVLDEWRVRDQTASGRLFDQISDLFLAGTAYDGHAPIGGDEAIRETEADDLRRYYDDWYRPDNAAIVVVGDVDADETEAAIRERFGDVVARSEAPVRPDLSVEPRGPAARVAGDADLADGYAFVTLAAEPGEGRSPEAEAQTDLLRGLAFDIVATRVNEAALRGEAPFDTADVDSSAFVRDQVAPEVYVRGVDGADVESSVQTILDEYERVRRFGFTPAEVERAASRLRSEAQTAFDGRRSRQDSSYADEYVDVFLRDEPFVAAETEFDFISAVVDGATPETVAHVFVEHLADSSVHVFAGVPLDELRDVASEQRLLELVSATSTRSLDPPTAAIEIGDELMVAPEAIEPISNDSLADRPFPGFIDPTVVTFPNGVRVALNPNEIVTGQVTFEGRSPGGLSVVDDADVADAQALGSVLSESGVGEFDRVALDAFLDDKVVGVGVDVGPFEESISGRAATKDLETLFQLVHLTMTEPDVDPVALRQYVDSVLPYAENPGLDADYAAFVAYSDARYDDVRFLPATPESLATVDVDGLRRVAADRFGDAGDWAFSLAGDFVLSDGIELAGRYLATLPATDREEDPGFDEEPPPAGPVLVETRAGEGETASVSIVFTSSAGTERRDDLLGRLVQEIVTNRLTDVVREQLGDSYSPFASVTIGPGATPSVEVSVSVSAAPERVTDVSSTVLAQLDDLRANGPTDREFSNAIASVTEASNFFNNPQVNDEILDAIVDPEGSADFDDFLDEFDTLGSVRSDEVRDALRRWTSADDYIEVRVLPRS